MPQVSATVPHVAYRRLHTRQVMVGTLAIGGTAPLSIQTMTTTDTMDTAATVAQTIRCIEAGAQLVRITAPSKKEAENLQNIKKAVRGAGFTTPLVADIHFTPNAAEIAARIVEKVRVNPGNYVDKKRFDQINYTDAEYAAEIDRIRHRFTPLVSICKDHGTAMRIGTNHGSLSDRIMSRYGDTPMGMVESAMEFLRIARGADYHQIILSMKSSNPLVVLQAYRLLVQQMQAEFGECYPLHLGVTEAGDGEDGRIKSAIGIGTLLEEGIGDTIRVSLTEEPEAEIPVCRDLVAKYNTLGAAQHAAADIPYAPQPSRSFMRRHTHAVANIGGGQLPVVVADFSEDVKVLPETLAAIGYRYEAALDKWHIADAAADYLFLGDKSLDFHLPGTLRAVQNFSGWQAGTATVPLFSKEELLATDVWQHLPLVFVALYPEMGNELALADELSAWKDQQNLVFCIVPAGSFQLLSLRQMILALDEKNLYQPAVWSIESTAKSRDQQLIEMSIAGGGPFLDGQGDGLWLMNDAAATGENQQLSGRQYNAAASNHQFLNNTAFSILQASRMRISKTEYISCPSCGRTLFDLQETTTKIRNATHHLKGLKIAVMGCIVNGPGEMADADFGYVGSGPGKISLYKGKEVVKKNVPSEVAVAELVLLLQEEGVWLSPEA